MAHCAVDNCRSVVTIAALLYITTAAAVVRYALVSAATTVDSPPQLNPYPLKPTYSVQYEEWN
jgi:hypothetical protein